jgi:hypothetical protein
MPPGNVKKMPTARMMVTTPKISMNDRDGDMCARCCRRCALLGELPFEQLDGRVVGKHLRDVVAVLGR